MIMKKTDSLLKIGLVGLFLTISSAIIAQTGPAAPTPVTPITSATNLDIGRINDDETSVVTDPTAVFFYNPTNGGTEVNLQASATDDHTPEPNTFSYYAWYRVNEAGTEQGSSLGSAQSLSLSAGEVGLLQPGFHRFRVYGFVGDAAAEFCESEEFQDIILFVLNPLNPTATNTDAITEFCIGDTGTFGLEATVTFEEDYENTSFPNPLVGDFDLTYTWFAVLDGDTDNAIQLTSATTTTDGATASATIDFDELDEAGTYTFYVEVAYSSAIKSNTGFDEGHGFWRAYVEDGGTNYQIVVTPRPGRPTITIGTVVE